MWRHLARPVGKGHRHLVSFARCVSGIVGDQGQNVMQIGLGGAWRSRGKCGSKANMACKMGGVGRCQGQHVMARRNKANLKVIQYSRGVKQGPSLRLIDARNGAESVPHLRLGEAKVISVRVGNFGYGAM